MSASSVPATGIVETSESHDGMSSILIDKKGLFGKLFGMGRSESKSHAPLFALFRELPAGLPAIGSPAWLWKFHTIHGWEVITAQYFVPAVS
jgi:hypothetical protein